MADDAKAPIRPARPCPVCGKPVDPAGRFRPFCSARCRQVDLGRWLAGDYAFRAERRNCRVMTTRVVERVDRPPELRLFPAASAVALPGRSLGVPLGPR